MICKKMELHKIKLKDLLNALPKDIYAHHFSHKNTPYLQKINNRPIKYTILDILKQKPGYVTKEYLINYLWGHDETGGPEDPDSIIRIMICQLRKEGHAIESGPKATKQFRYLR